MKKNIYLDEINKDLTLTSEKNLRVTSTLSEFVSQKIENKLMFFKAEWFLNFELGIPYFDNIFVKNPDINLINTIFIREIRSIEEIIEIIKFETEYNPQLRTYAIDYEIKISDGTIVENSFSI
jgi:uncharacterized protein (DUF2164 family)